MSVTDRPIERSTGLRTGALGATGIVFVVVAGAAPLTGLAGNVPLGVSLGNGIGLPGAYVLVGAMLLLFSVGFVALSRHVVNAGAFYAYIEYGLGRNAGRVAAYLATLAYNTSVTSLTAAFAFFAGTVLRTQVGVSVPWELLALVAIVTAGVLNHAGIAVSTNLLAVLMALEVGLVLAVNIAATVHRGAHFSSASFAPQHVFDGGVAVALLFAVLSFAGFEATAIFAEETREPRRTVRMATYAVVVVMAGLFVWSSWAVVASFDNEQALLTASADTGNFLSAITRQHLGGWSVDTLNVLVVLSFLASVIAVHTMAARYLFALGRAGLLPAWLGAAHPQRHTPHRAGLVQVLVSVAILAAFSLAGGDPLTDVVPALAGLFALAFLTLMAGTSFAAFRAFRTRIAGGGPWSTVVAPLASGILLVATAVLLIVNYGLLAGSDSTVVVALPWVMFGLAIAAALVARRRASVPLPDMGDEGVPRP